MGKTLYDLEVTLEEMKFTHSNKERDDLRLQKIEMQQQMAELNRLVRTGNKKSNQNLTLSRMNDTGVTMRKRFSKNTQRSLRLLKNSKREAVKEAERKLTTSTPKYDDKIEELEKKIKEQNEYIAQQQAYANLTHSWVQLGEMLTQILSFTSSLMGQRCAIGLWFQETWKRRLRFSKVIWRQEK